MAVLPWDNVAYFKHCEERPWPSEEDMQEALAMTSKQNNKQRQQELVQFCRVASTNN